MVYYKLVLTTINVDQLVEILIKTVINYQDLPDLIVINQRSLFTSKFWSLFCYYFNVKRRLSIAFCIQTNRKSKRQSNTIEVYFQVGY